MTPTLIRRLARAAATLAVGAACLVAVPGPSAATDVLRVLIVGDSTTQGSTGDWTWRYRLWKQFEASGVAVDFVGPHDDLVDPATDEPGSYGYLDPDFDTDHAAKWGMQLATQEYSIADLVATYHPDVVVEQLGVNDLTFGKKSPVEVEALLRTFVADARKADPDVDLVLGAVPHLWLPGVPEFDAALPGLADELDADGSRVVATSVGPGFQPEDTWDGGHPSATGEMRIAVAVADALATLGAPVAFARPPPTVENGPPHAAVLRAQAGDELAQLTWEQPLGADHEYLWMRDATAGEDWIRLYFPVTGTTWTAEGLVNSHRYEYRLQATKGTAVAEHVFSNVATVWPAPAPPGPVSSLDVVPADHALVITWGAADGASRYRVSWWPLDRPADVARAEVTEPELTVPDLQAGLPYAVSVEPLADWVPGPTSIAQAVPLGPVPAAVPAPSLTQDRRHRVLVSWLASTDATSYRISMRSAHGSWRELGSTTARRWRTGELVAGRTYLVRVRADHQYVTGAASPVARIKIRAVGNSVL